MTYQERQDAQVELLKAALSGALKWLDARVEMAKAALR